MNDVFEETDFIPQIVVARNVEFRLLGLFLKNYTQIMKIKIKIVKFRKGKIYIKKRF